MNEVHHTLKIYLEVFLKLQEIASLGSQCHNTDMEIQWSFKREDQIIYYIKQAKQVQNGFFQKIRAVIIPYLHPDGWFLPDYNLFDNKEFIRRLENVSTEDYSVADKELKDFVNEKFDLDVHEDDSNHDQKLFEERCDNFLEKCKEFFPIATKIASIIIVPTRFGTGSSYYFSSKDDITLFITYRLDGSVERIFKSIISILVYISFENDDSTLENWRMRVAIDDFVSNNTVFKTFFTNSSDHSTLEFMDDYKGELVEHSSRYFAKMGYPLQSSFTNQNGTTFFNQKPVIGLSNKEIEILDLLIKRKRQIVTFDELGDVYWKSDPDKFSLASLAKAIEKLRNNLEKNGIPESFIRTVRKRGYLLFD